MSSPIAGALACPCPVGAHLEPCREIDTADTHAIELLAHAAADRSCARIAALRGDLTTYRCCIRAAALHRAKAIRILGGAP